MFTKMKYASAVEVVSLSAWLKRLFSERVTFSSFNVFRFCEYIQVASAGPRRGLDYLARGRAGEAARQRLLFRNPCSSWRASRMPPPSVASFSAALSAGWAASLAASSPSGTLCVAAGWLGQLSAGVWEPVEENQRSQFRLLFFDSSR